MLGLDARQNAMKQHSAEAKQAAMFEAGFFFVQAGDESVLDAAECFSAANEDMYATKLREKMKGN